MRTLVPLSVVLVVLVSSGTAYAAQGALPGDPLYSIKVNVTEPVEGALAISQSSKAQWHADIAQRRLEEAETLASEGKLTASTSAQLATNFDTHATEAIALADNLQHSDPESAVSITAQFDSSLQAHGAILTQLGDDSPDQQTKVDSNTLATRARTYERASSHEDASIAMAAEPTTTASTSQISSSVSATISSSTGSTTLTTGSSPASTSQGGPQATSSLVVTTIATSVSASTSVPQGKVVKNKLPKSDNATDTQSAIALRMQQRAVDALSGTRKGFASIEGDLASSTADAVAAQLDATQNVVAQGSVQLQAGDSEGARQTFTQAFKTSVQLDAYLKAGKKFNKQLLPTLLNLLGAKGEKNSLTQDTSASSSHNNSSDQNSQDTQGNSDNTRTSEKKSNSSKGEINIHIGL